MRQDPADLIINWQEDNVMKKKLVVFCDGTWNEPDKNPTNVAKLFESTCQDDINGIPQIVYYIQGVGTHWYDRFMGGAFGWGISDNIKDGYKFLCSNYEPGDDIYLFGFSRGAFTARSLAGFIHNMGILKREYFDKSNEAYARYKDKSIDWHPNPTKGLKAKSFRDQYTYGGETIRFLGVWDTVGALGAPYGLFLGKLSDIVFGCRFHDVTLSDTIQSASHALSSDERRWPFRPVLWKLKSGHHSDDFVENWFPGVHSDVGGGYAETGLSDIALNWMAQQAAVQGLNTRVLITPSPSVPHDSQTLYYRLATLLAVKWPTLLLVEMPGKIFKGWPVWLYRKLNALGFLAEEDMAAKIARITPKGNYQRI